MIWECLLLNAAILPHQLGSILVVLPGSISAVCVMYAACTLSSAVYDVYSLHDLAMFIAERTLMNSVMDSIITKKESHTALMLPGNTTWILPS